MKNKYWTIAGSVLLAGLTFQPVMAEQAASTGFSQLDTDQDGYISSSEAGGSQSLTENWSKVDSNQDGQVDMVEFSAMEIIEAPSTEGQTGGQ